MSLITLKTFDNSIDAHLLKSKLESEGIVCYLFDEHTVTMYPFYNVTVGGIKLKINEMDLEMAKEIYNSIQATPFTDDENEIIKCPRCESTELYSNFKSMKGAKGIISAFTSFFFVLYPIYYKSVYKCKKCGAEFKRPNKADTKTN